MQSAQGPAQRLAFDRVCVGLQSDKDSAYIAHNAPMVCGIDSPPATAFVEQENSMLRSLSLLLVFPLVLGVSGALAQTKKPSPPGKMPTAKDSSISVIVYMKDGNKNEVLLGTRIWPGYPEHNTVVLQRFFAVMKALEPPYKQDDEVAYTWAAKGRVTKCSIYLESAEAGAKNGTGAVVGCEANGVSSLSVTSAADPKHAVSSSEDPKHLSDVMELFASQSARAKNNLPK
jgi:hypothetical protein